MEKFKRSIEKIIGEAETSLETQRKYQHESVMENIGVLKRSTEIFHSAAQKNNRLDVARLAENLSKTVVQMGDSIKEIPLDSPCHSKILCVYLCHVSIVALALKHSNEMEGVALMLSSLLLELNGLRDERAECA